MDNVPLVRSVMFIAEFFSLITSVTLDEELRHPGEIDEDFALRLASEFMLGYYGWDVAAVSNEIGVMDDSYDEPLG